MGIKTARTQYSEADAEHLIALYSIYKRRLRALELQEARLEISADPAIVIEIQDIKKQLVSLEQSIHTITKEEDMPMEASKKRPLSIGCLIYFFMILSIYPGISILILIVLIGAIVYYMSLSPWFFLIAAIFTILFFIFIRYITSGGDSGILEQVNTTLGSLILGLISIFLGFGVAISTNLLSDKITQLSSSDANFVVTITSLIVGLLSITISVSLYVFQREKDTQKDLDGIRKSQNIITEDKPEGQARQGATCNGE